MFILTSEVKFSSKFKSVFIFNKLSI